LAERGHAPRMSAEGATLPVVLDEETRLPAENLVFITIQRARPTIGLRMRTPPATETVASLSLRRNDSS
jgi:hypothetical protein